MSCSHAWSIRAIAERIPKPAIVRLLKSVPIDWTHPASISFELTRDEGGIENTTPGVVMGIPMNSSTPDELIEDFNQAIGSSRWWNRAKAG
jgi:hypothetical protein